MSIIEEAEHTECKPLPPPPARPLTGTSCINKMRTLRSLSVRGAGGADAGREGWENPREGLGLPPPPPPQHYLASFTH
ncbi:hypothetical protein SK128_000120, partial [Halocaridina rubra]